MTRHGCESCCRCRSIDRNSNTVACRIWTAPNGIAREDIHLVPLIADGCDKWKPIAVETTVLATVRKGDLNWKTNSLNLRTPKKKKK